MFESLSNLIPKIASLMGYILLIVLSLKIFFDILKNKKINYKGSLLQLLLICILLFGNTLGEITTPLFSLKRIKEKAENHLKEIESILEKTKSDVDYLKKINELSKLSNDAISNGSRKAYEQLIDLMHKYDNSGNDILKNAANIELITILNILCPYRNKSSQNIPSSKKEIFDLLNTNNINKREIGAVYSRYYKDIEVAKTILKHAETEQNLGIYLKLLDSFKVITGCPYALLSYRDAKVWWDINKEKLLTNMNSQ